MKKIVTYVMDEISIKKNGWLVEVEMDNSDFDDPIYVIINEFFCDKLISDILEHYITYVNEWRPFREMISEYVLQNEYFDFLFSKYELTDVYVEENNIKYFYLKLIAKDNYHNINIHFTYEG